MFLIFGLIISRMFSISIITLPLSHWFTWRKQTSITVFYYSNSLFYCANVTIIRRVCEKKIRLDANTSHKYSVVYSVVKEPRSDSSGVRCMRIRRGGDALPPLIVL